MKKTNACRILDKHKIEYEVIEYEVDESDLSALHVAEVSGINIKQIFKTLVCIDEKNQPLVACIPGDDELDLKALAKVANRKKCVMIPQKDLLKLTGYIRGGCSPFGMKKLYPTFLHVSASEQEFICVSAGIRGAQIKLSPKALVQILQAKQENLIF
ncbi:MAG: Cys-tRNA(Pro)/Cys-tRNA(Cys) deacylase [Sulfurospirillum sp.]|jgi:Cys-tRNA(Pro)/Cys-tRNA(Cys) deacylase|nr:Cys-tRNA(Pro)/Cys-tRNA(Cys) deacylase [Sulfurospirillum sp.]DAB34657.1 MAG TPA: Cys-tRNA(Pro) deacylase [Sulfurospirillum sp. UBA12182]